MISYLYTEFLIWSLLYVFVANIFNSDAICVFACIRLLTFELFVIQHSRCYVLLTVFRSLADLRDFNDLRRLTSR